MRLHCPQFVDYFGSSVPPARIKGFTWTGKQVRKFKNPIAMADKCLDANGGVGGYQ